MADIRPFRGIRYNETLFPDLSKVIAPPHNFISPADYKLLCKNSPQNIVRLTIKDKDQKKAKHPYEPSAARLYAWLDNSTLVQERAPAIYLLEQFYENAGRTVRRRGFIARLRVEEFGKGAVIPHEATFPGPKANQLELAQTTQMNIEQVFGFYRDDDGTVKKLLDLMEAIEPVAEGTGIDGTRNVIRPVFHRALISRLIEAMRPKKIILGIGHHKYESAVEYRNLRRPKRGIPTFEEPYEFISAELVASDDPGLGIKPTHRLVTLPDFNEQNFFNAVSAGFAVQDAPSDLKALTMKLQELSERHVFGVVTNTGNKILLRRSGRRLNDGFIHSLDTYIFHHEILKEIFNIPKELWRRGGPVEYYQYAENCVRDLVAKKASIAFLLNPPLVEEVEAIALSSSDTILPPRTTEFIPKVPSGLVINPLV